MDDAVVEVHEDATAAVAPAAAVAAPQKRAADGDANAKSGKKAKTVEQLTVERFDKLTAAHSWAGDSAAHRKTYETKGTMHCTLCNSSIIVSANTGNMTVHANGKGHVAIKAAADASNSSMLINASAAAAVGMTSAEKAAKAAELKTLRVLAHANLVAGGMNPHLIGEVLDRRSATWRALSVLSSTKLNVGGDGTIRRDVEDAKEMLDDALRLKLKGTVGSIVTDGATYAHDKAVAILFSTSSLETPILLSLVWPAEEEGGYEGVGDADEAVYDHKKAALDIRRQCDSFGLSIGTQITVVMGDNVSFVDAMARELNLTRGHCLSHSESLVALHGMKELPDAVLLTQTAGGLIYAGGTDKRGNELRAEPYGLDPRKAQSYSNRFYTNVPNALYRLENFEPIKQWHTTSTLLPQVKDDDEKADDAKRPGKQAQLVKVAYGKPLAQVTLAVVKVLYGDIPALVGGTGDKGGTSAEFDHVREDLLVQLKLQRDLYAEASTASGAATVVEQAIDIVLTMKPMAEGLKKSARATLLKPVMEAATKSLESWDKNIAPQVEILTGRFRFDPRNKPEETPDGSYPKDFFKALPENYGLKLIAQYKAYIAEWASKPEDDWEGTVPFKYWSTKRQKWPELASIALWWIEVPTSSVAAERVFGVLRAMGTPQRQSMSRETISRELAFRINRAVLIELLDKQLAIVEKN